MNNKNDRKTGRTIFCCGFILLLMGSVNIGMAMVAVGLLMCVFMGRCPHCGALLLTLDSKAINCPKCHDPL